MGRFSLLGYHVKFQQFICVAIFLTFFASPAWAYLDPGSVSLWLQGLFAVIAALAASFRLWWYRLLALFGRGKKDTKAASTSPPESE